MLLGVSQPSPEVLSTLKSLSLEGKRMGNVAKPWRTVHGRNISENTRQSGKLGGRRLRRDREVAVLEDKGPVSRL